MLKQKQVMQSGHHAARKLMVVVRSAPRWLCLVGLLALVILSTGRTSDAQGQSLPLQIHYKMEIGNDRTTLCPQEKVTYPVKIKLVVEDPAAPNIGPMSVTGVRVTVEVDDLNIIKDITPEVNYLTLDVTEPYAVNHIFQAQKKRGATVIHFTGAIRANRDSSALNEYFPVKIDQPVKVVDCQYRVSAISHWFLDQGDGNHFGVYAVIDRATLAADANGQLTGKADIKWYPNITHVPGGGGVCNSDEKLGQSQAIMTGELTPNDEIEVKVTYKPTTLAGKIGCKNVPNGIGGFLVINQSVNLQVVAAPLDITVPISGSPFTSGQDLMVGQDTQPGTVTGDIAQVVPSGK